MIRVCALAQSAAELLSPFNVDKGLSGPDEFSAEKKNLSIEIR